MVAKVSVGKTFGSTVDYLFDGHLGEEQKSDKKAILLDYNGIRPGQKEMIRDFNCHRLMNPDLGNAVAHISISYHPNDSERATNSTMVDHARQLMQRMGIDPDNTQYALIRHHDKDHQHCHLLYNRVDFDGCTISDAHNYKRSHEAIRAIAQSDGFTVASGKKKDLKLTHPANMPGHDQAKYTIYQAIQKELPAAASIEGLKHALKAHGIETEVQKGGKGMSFKFERHVIKASDVDRRFSGGKLHAQVEQNQAQQAIALAMGQALEKESARRQALARHQATMQAPTPLRDHQEVLDMVLNRELRASKGEISPVKEYLSTNRAKLVEEFTTYYGSEVGNDIEKRVNYLLRSDIALVMKKEEFEKAGDEIDEKKKNQGQKLR